MSCVFAGHHDRRRPSCCDVPSLRHGPTATSKGFRSSRAASCPARCHRHDAEPQRRRRGEVRDHAEPARRVDFTSREHLLDPSHEVAGRAAVLEPLQLRSRARTSVRSSCVGWSTVAIHATLSVQHHRQATLEPEHREEPSRRTLDTRYEQVHSEVERHSEPGRDEILSPAGYADAWTDAAPV